MRWPVDECVHARIVRVLRSDGHDVLAVAEAFPSLNDGPVLAAAVAENRILLTQDLDFGELVFRRRLPAMNGIVLIRTRLHSIDAVCERFRMALKELGHSLEGRYVVIDDNRIRSRVLK